MIKPVKGYEGIYSVSDDGTVYSHISNRPLSKGPNKNQYVCIRLCKDGIERPFRIHRIVAEAFIPNPDNKEEVNHKNGIKNDNRVENLEWVTRSENHIHAYSDLKRKKSSGKLNWRSRLTLDLQTGIFYDSCREAILAKGFNINSAKARPEKFNLLYC